MMWKHRYWVFLNIENVVYVLVPKLVRRYQTDKETWVYINKRRWCICENYKVDINRIFLGKRVNMTYSLIYQ